MSRWHLAVWNQAPDYLVYYFLYCCDPIPSRKQLEGKGLIWAHDLRYTVHHSRKGTEADVWATSCLQSGSRKRIESRIKTPPLPPLTHFLQQGYTWSSFHKFPKQCHQLRTKCANPCTSEEHLTFKPHHLEIIYLHGIHAVQFWGHTSW